VGGVSEKQQFEKLNTKLEKNCDQFCVDKHSEK
jgi:hypothetical protein